MDTKTAPYPPGITPIAPDSVRAKARQARETHAEVTRDLSKVGKLKLFFKMSEAGELVKIIAKRAKALTRVEELAAAFRMVRLDETLKRKVLVRDRRDRREREISVPFIFSAKLPAKSKRSYTVVIGPREESAGFNVMTADAGRVRRRTFRPWANRPRRYTVSAVTPIPPDAALAALQQHADKFDHAEVWWVPKDVKVKEVRERLADPIVVGVITAPRKNREPERFCFELYRWEQPDLEKPYFAHEAY